MDTPTSMCVLAMIKARSVLNTASNDTPETLQNPARGRTIARAIQGLSDALEALDKELYKDQV